jgi:3',5'-cyclic AMP phosphodiesterase CpdA
MEMTRRKFLGVIGAFTLTSCAHRIPLIGGGGSEEPWTVAGLSDLHVKGARSAAIVNRAVDQINAIPDVRFSVVIGDLATSGQLAELNLAKESLDRFSRPYFAVPGNHDVETRSSDPYGNFKRNFGEPSWIHEESQWVFFGLDTCEGAASDVAVRPDRLDWIEKRLRKIGANRPIGVFAHHPFGPSTKAYRVKNADEVLGLFSGHNLRFVA